MRYVGVLVFVLGCGHTLRSGAGPLVDSNGHPGLVASFEVGTHLIGSKEVAMPVGFRFEASATGAGMQGLVGFAFGGTLPPGGRRSVASDSTETRRGWGGRLAVATGALFDEDGVAFGARGGLALTRGAIKPGALTGGGCYGTHEKTRSCYSWRRWSYVHTGVELGTMLRFTTREDDPMRRLHLDGWRVSAEVVHERGVFSDLQL